MSLVRKAIRKHKQNKENRISIRDILKNPESLTADQKLQAEIIISNMDIPHQSINTSKVNVKDESKKPAKKVQVKVEPKEEVESKEAEIKEKVAEDKDLYAYVMDNKDSGAEDIIPSINKCLEMDLSDKKKAMLYRTLGEIALVDDDKQSAKDNFEKALELNEKVGIKRQYNKLVKELAE